MRRYKKVIIWVAVADSVAPCSTIGFMCVGGQTSGCWKVREDKLNT